MVGKMTNVTKEPTIKERERQGAEAAVWGLKRTLLSKQQEVKRWIIFAFALASAVGRIFITPRLTNIPSPEMSYEAFVHLFVGGLIGVSWYDWNDKQATLYGRIGWALAFWELGWFIVQKLHT